jgi:hypothetical protein
MHVSNRESIRHSIAFSDSVHCFARGPIMLLTRSRLVIGTSRTVGSAKKFVRITSGFGGGEFTKTLRKVFFVGRLILRELHFIYNNKLCMFLIVKAFATA